MTSSNAASTICSDGIIPTESAAASSEDMKQRLKELLDWSVSYYEDVRDYLLTQKQARNNKHDGDETTQVLKEALLSTNFLHHFIGSVEYEEEVVIEIINLILDVCPDCVHAVFNDEDNDCYRNTYPLHIACERGGSADEAIMDKIINILLDKCSNTSSGTSLLGGLDHIVAFGCCDSVLENYDNVGGCPLSYYITWGGDDIEIVRRMVNLCPASLTLSCEETKMTPLHIILRSCYSKKFTADVVKLFVETDASCVTLKDGYGCHPLLCLCIHGSDLEEDDAIQILDTLLDAYPEAAFMKDKRGVLPLQYALWEYYPSQRMGQKFCRRFIERTNVDANAFVTQLEGLCNAWDATPMPYTAIQAMIDYIPRVGASAISERMVGSSFFFDILRWYCEPEKKKATLQIIQSLLDLCPGVANITSNVHCSESSTREAAYPIHAACCWGAQDEVIKLILSKTDPKALEVMCVVDDGIFEGGQVPGCPLHYCMTRGTYNIDIMRQIVEMGGVDLLQLRDSNNKLTPLQALMCSFDVQDCQDVVEYMIKLDPTILQIRDKHGNFPIHNACHNGSLTLPVLQVLVKLCPESLSEISGNGCLPLHILCMNSKLHGYQAPSLDDTTLAELLAFLLKKNPESISVRDPDGDLPVKIAASCQGPQFCKCLVESLPNQVREEILESQGLLLVACSSGLPETVQYFVQLFGPECLRTCSPVNIGNRIYQMAPIHAAMRNDHCSADITRILLKLDDTLASFKMTATVGHPGQVKHILPLHIHLSSSLPSMDVVQMLFDAYPGVILLSDSKGDDASTLIRKAILKLDSTFKYKREEIQKILDFVEKQKEYCTLARRGAEHLTTPDEHGRLLLHKALTDKGVSFGTIKIVVIEEYTAVRVADNDGLYPLHIAAMNCTLDIFFHVFRFDKSAVNNVDNEGNNILHYACKTGNMKVIEYIIHRHGSLASKMNNKGQFPIVTLLDKDGKEGNITKTAEYTGVVMKMLLAYPEFVVPAIECR